MIARHQPHPTVDVVRIRVPSSEPLAGHPSALAPFVSTLIDVTCDSDLRACARNTVLHDVSGDWIVFVDERVEMVSFWIDALGRDLAAASARGDIACSLGAGGARAGGSVDVAYRRDVLELLGPFDEPPIDAWTTDLDMQLRIVAAGYEVRPGSRRAR